MIEGRYRIFDRYNHHECVIDTKDGRIYGLELLINILNSKEEMNIRLGQELDIMIDIFDQSGLDYEPMTEEELNEYIQKH